jgi:hypothetical protein
MSSLALGSAQWVKQSFTCTPTNMPAWHRQEKICFCLFKCCVCLCHTELLCKSLDHCFLVVFTWRNPKNNFSCITIQLLLDYCQERLFVPGVLYIFIAPLEEHCHNSKNTTYQERGKTTGRGNAIASKERHFSPLAAILENRCVTPFH